MLERPLAGVPPWRWWVGFVVATCLALVLTYLAYAELLPPALERIWHFDKLMHFSVAGLLAFFLDGALRRRELQLFKGSPIPLAAVGVLAPAGCEELLQTFSTVRTPSVWDFAADVAGVLVCIALSRRVARPE